MNRRMTLATVSAAVVLTLGLSGCSDDPENAPTPVSSDDPLASNAPPTEPAAVPSVDSSTDASIALRGEWGTDDMNYVVNFIEDGTFTLDRDGISNVNSGTYEVENNVVKMYGVDGTTVEGQVDDDVIVIDDIELNRL